MRVHVCDAFERLKRSFVLSEKHREADAEAAPTVHPVGTSCSPPLTEPARSTTEVQGAANMRKNAAAPRHLVGARFFFLIKFKIRKRVLEMYGVFILKSKLWQSCRRHIAASSLSSYMQFSKQVSCAFLDALE